MDANRKWDIVITDCGTEIGSPITTTAWDVLSKLAAVRSTIPSGWQAEAYPQIQTWISYEH